MSQKYKDDGVNVVEGDNFSQFATNICKSTYDQSPFVKISDLSLGNFRGPRVYNFINLPDGSQHILAPDGIGTKVVIIDSANSHRHAAQDLFAMTSTDISRCGGLPLVFTSVLDVSSLGEDGDEKNRAFREMLLGLKEASQKIGVVCLNGETAELGACVSSENESALTQFNWAGVMHGVFHKDRMVTGETLADGQVVMTLKEDGFRSNGISSVRKALALKFGGDWYINESQECRDAVLAASKPSVLYDNFLAEINGWHGDEKSMDVHAIAHISGGGIVSKLYEDLLKKRGLSAVLEHLWEPPSIMQEVANWRDMDDSEIYKTWNGGQGALVVINASDIEKFQRQASQHNLQARSCGLITKEDKPSLIIRSKFSSGKKLVYK